MPYCPDNMTKNVHVFKDPEALAESMGNQLMAWIADARGDHFHLALSGGTTPNLLFSALASKYSDSVLWQKVHFWWADERMVPPDHPESNFGVARKLLFSKIVLPEKNIHRVRGEMNPLQEAASYAQKIAEELKISDGWPLFDLILLGMGEDGHTASIFPDQLEMLESEHFCEVAYHPVTLQPRITLTGRVINHARNICFLVTGTNKAGRLSEILSENEKAKLLPATYVQPVNGKLHWYIDKNAAQLLP
jgi:6-phosphogluconolactonase